MDKPPAAETLAPDHRQFARQNARTLEKQAEDTILTIEHFLQSLEHRSVNIRYVDWKTVVGDMEQLRKVVQALVKLVG